MISSTIPMLSLVFRDRGNSNVKIPVYHYASFYSFILRMYKTALTPNEILPVPSVEFILLKICYGNIYFSRMFCYFSVCGVIFFTFYLCLPINYFFGKFTGYLYIFIKLVSLVYYRYLTIIKN